MPKLRSSFAKAALLLLILGAAAPSFAGNEAHLDLDVTIAGSLSVSVSAANSSTQTLAWNSSNANEELVAAASATVTNDSGGLTERWALSTNAQSINTAGNAPSWTLVTSTSPALPGADQFALQAVFGSSNTAAGACPGVGAADWNDGSAKPLTA